ncbi:hypothetical protein [Mycolicibacterium goodii]|uniref:hypothetical protein n=1 Tax=Mycolicibacterium goodii TaxID=134601 RepID=UPI000C25A5AB|nr:hypothetical protein [Mycolicibacterium goodii]PJK23864.1 hypothetical protein CSX11_03305 [Mycolicibacterium goodii]
MAELSCKLSALAFAELYRILGGASEYHENLEDRLNQLSYGIGWLAEASEAYDEKWISDAEFIDAGSAEDFALPGEHALLATWLLAGLRNTGDSYDFSANLREAVQERMGREAQSLSGTRPPSFSPIVRGWALGRVDGLLDPLFPVVPAAYPSDPHIAAAYLGLVEHLLHLEDFDLEWPELAGTALLVRTGGLAEALRPPPPPPPHRGLSHSINLLMSEARRHMPLQLWERLVRHWVPWVEWRNVLTHVRPTEGAGYTFGESAELLQSWERIEFTIVGITQFVCQEISQELLDVIPPALRTDPWESYLRREIQTEWT